LSAAVKSKRVEAGSFRSIFQIQSFARFNLLKRLIERRALGGKSLEASLAQ
jgi:hypothetical protein